MKTKKVIEFSASWCGPCKVFAKTFDAVKNNSEFSNITFETHDIEESDEIEEMVDKYRVQGVPTVLLFDENDNLLDRLTGNIPQTLFEDKIRNA